MTSEDKTDSAAASGIEREYMRVIQMRDCTSTLCKTPTLKQMKCPDAMIKDKNKLDKHPNNDTQPPLHSSNPLNDETSLRLVEKRCPSLPVSPPAR